MENTLYISIFTYKFSMWFMKIAKGRTVGKSELGLKFIAQGPGQNLGSPPCGKIHVSKMYHFDHF